MLKQLPPEYQGFAAAIPHAVSPLPAPNTARPETPPGTHWSWSGTLRWPWWWWRWWRTACWRRWMEMLQMQGCWWWGWRPPQPGPGPPASASAPTAGWPWPRPASSTLTPVSVRCRNRPTAGEWPHHTTAHCRRSSRVPPVGFQPSAWLCDQGSRRTTHGSAVPGTHLTFPSGVLFSTQISSAGGIAGVPGAETGGIPGGNIIPGGGGMLPMERGINGGL